MARGKSKATVGVEENKEMRGRDQVFIGEFICSIP